MVRSVNDEIELKLEVDAAGVALLKQHALLQDSAPQIKPQLSVYYDTPKGRLRKQGFSLRVRRVDGGFVQTVKPTTESAGLFARDEWETPVGSIDPDLGKLAGTPLEPLKRQGKLKKLVPVVRSDVQRTSWRLTRAGSTIQVDLDEGSITGGDRSQILCELELELVDGEPAELFRVARLFAESVPMRIGVLSKAERGFALADNMLDRVHKAGAVAVEPGMTVAAAFAVVALACIKHFRLNEPVVIASRNPSALHQTRVAMRRMRSAFALFRPALSGADYGRLRGELRWFTSQLGDARNLDVYLERDLAEDERRALTERREDAYVQVIEAMESRRLRDLMLDLAGWVALGDWQSNKRALRPIGPYAEKRLEKMWSIVVGPAAQIADMDEAVRHALRIEVKKLRYAVEFLRGVYPDEAGQQKKVAAAVEALQEELGKLNDLTTARALGTADVAEDNQAEHLAEAERHARVLIELRPFWRSEATQAGIGWLLRSTRRKARQIRKLSLSEDA
jgi:triphosphatase